MSSIGLFIIAGIAISIQLLNNFPTDARGLIQAADPAVFNRMTYVSDKYLKNVGIYSRWPLDDISNSNSSAAALGNYIWLADITEVVNQSVVDISIKTDYNANSNNQNYTLCFLKATQSTCYSVQNGSMSSKIDDKNRIDSLLKLPSISNNGYEINLVKAPAQQLRYKIGYVDYNLNKFIASKTGERVCTQSIATSLLFAKYASAPNTFDNNSFLKFSSFGYSFFSLDYDLLTVDKFWRTGIVRCQMSGDLGPKLNRQIRLVC